MKKIEKNELKNVSGGGKQKCWTNILGLETTCAWVSSDGKYGCVGRYSWSGETLSKQCGTNMDYQ